METTTVGRVLTEAKIENLRDVWDVQRGLQSPEQARAIAVTDALVDTGATLLSIPTHLIRQLGLSPFNTTSVRGSSDITETDLYDPVRLTIQGRSCTMDVVEVPDGVPVLIGQLPLEHLDLVIDPRSRTLTGNPPHGGEHIYELL